MHFQVDTETAVRRVLTGDQHSFEVLVERYLPMVYAISHGQLGTLGDVDDIVQEAYLRAFRSLKSLRDPKKFPSWMATITRNACTDHVKARRRGQSGDDAWVQHAASSYIDDPAQRELYAMVEQAVHELDPKHREILLLYYFSNRDLTEIEGTFNISHENAKKRLQRARAALETHISDKLGEVLDAYRPSDQKVGMVMGAVALCTPYGVHTTLGAAGLGALVGVEIMGKKLIVAAIAALALAGIGLGFAYSRSGARHVSKPIANNSVATSTASDTSRATSSSASVTASDPRKQAEEERDDKAIGKRADADTARTQIAGATGPRGKNMAGYHPAKAFQRSAMAGGGPQRTGFFNVHGPLKQPAVTWEKSFGGPSAYPGTVLAIDPLGRVFAVHGEAQKNDEFSTNWLSAYSASGEKLWDSDPIVGKKPHAVPSVLSNGNVVEKFRDSSLRAFDPSTGRVVWTTDLGRPGSSSATVDSHDNIYLDAAFDAGVVKVDGRTGEVLWPHTDLLPTGTGSFSTSPALSMNEDTVYTLGQHQQLPDGKISGELVALNAADGSLRWSYAPEGIDHFLVNSWATPTVGGDGTVYVQDSWTGHLFAIADNGNSPAELWDYDPASAGSVLRFEATDSYVWTPSASSIYSHDAPRSLATDGEAIYMGVFGSPASIHAVNTDGTPLWHTTLENDAIAGSPAVTIDAVYVQGGGDDTVPGDNALYCIDKHSGTILWQMPLTRPHGDTGESVAFGPDGTIYVMSQSISDVGVTIRALR